MLHSVPAQFDAGAQIIHRLVALAVTPSQLGFYAARFSGSKKPEVENDADDEALPHSPTTWMNPEAEGALRALTRAMKIPTNMMAKAARHAGRRLDVSVWWECRCDLKARLLASSYFLVKSMSRMFRNQEMR